MLTTSPPAVRCVRDTLICSRWHDCKGWLVPGVEMADGVWWCMACARREGVSVPGPPGAASEEQDAA